MSLQLSGTAAFTGGSKGIGLAVVRTLLDEGMRVVSASPVFSGAAVLWLLSRRTNASADDVYF